MKQLSKEKRKRLDKDLQKKMQGESLVTFEVLAKKYGVSRSTVINYNNKFVWERKIEAIRAEYESRIRILEKRVASKKEHTTNIMEMLYDICMNDRKEAACIAWLRATGVIKKAEVDAKDGSSVDVLDWETEVEKLWKKE